MTARRVTLFLHSRAGARLLCLIGLAVIAVCALAGVTQAPAILPGLVGGTAGIAGAIAADLIIIAVYRLINKQFNTLRHETSLGAPLLVSLLAAVPWLGATLFTGTILPLTMLPVSYLLFTTYSDRSATRLVFLLFAIIAAMTFVTPVFAWYLPVLLIGCAQMRILSLRCILAALMGVITPAWIAVGFGLCPIDALPHPSIDLPWVGHTTPQVDSRLMPIVGGVIALGAGLMFANLYKILSYNAKTRSMNGFYAMLLIATIILSLIDLHNTPLYMPLLFTLVSYQATLFFVTRTGERSCIGIIALMALLWGSYIYNIIWS